MARHGSAKVLDREERYKNGKERSQEIFSATFGGWCRHDRRAAISTPYAAVLARSS